ncbi:MULTISPECIES: hypothetical protein [Bacillaceae]|uniref:Uncharacterized protein n=1 Tax=Lederbergia citri TaxID=2833580 RepID=A0A942T9E1_9BACI|nr:MULTISPECIES: hypothetical protein [Bacillaceae]MBS4193691.1 hypothetical protein [Lederbergia citri]
MTKELEVLVDSIDRIANGCIIAVAIFFVITLIKFFINNRINDNLPEQMAKKIETILEWTSLMTFNIGVMWAILNN